VSQRTDQPRQRSSDPSEGWEGWDEYASFYDWENARTVGRRDVAFWRDLALRAGGRTLELGCGTGRVLVPLARAGVRIVGLDRSRAMLARARARLRRRPPASSTQLVRGDVRQVPFAADAGFNLAIAPYGLLQSILDDRDLHATLRAVARVLAPGGLFGIDLVPDVPAWREYSRRVALHGRRSPRGAPITLIESVRQDRANGRTYFDQEFREGTGRRRTVKRFSLAFRTIPMPMLRTKLARAGFDIDAILGSYDGSPWDPRANTWVVLARKVT
jgi:SAM-dependent methyltransferase